MAEIGQNEQQESSNGIPGSSLNNLGINTSRDPETSFEAAETFCNSNNQHMVDASTETDFMKWGVLANLREDLTHLVLGKNIG